MNMRGMLSKESLRALEQLGRSPVRRPPEQPPKAAVPKKVMIPQRRLPFILDVIRSVGCDTIYFEDPAGYAIRGLVIAHWSKEELRYITEAIEASKFMYRKTWRNTWAVVITC